MGKPKFNREKEPFEINPDFSEPVRFGDFKVDYGKDDPATNAAEKIIAEEDGRMGKQVTNQPDGARRIKQLSDGFELRCYPPHWLWRVLKDGELVDGDFTNVQLAEKAAERYKAKKN